MRRKVVPVALMTGQYVTHNYPNTILTQADNSEKAIESASTENYSMIYAGYMPLGVTDEIICYEGENSSAADLFTKHHGQTNTLLYGPMSTYAHQALLSGFKVFFLNLRLPDSTYPNMYLALDVSPAKEEFEIFAYLNQETGYYSIAALEDDLPDEAFDDADGANIKVIKIPRYNIQMKPFNVADCRYGDLGSKTGARRFEVQKFLQESFEDTISTSTKPGLQLDETFHLPVVGLFYRGRGSYGNVFKFKTTPSPTKVNDIYPKFVGEVMNQGVAEHKFEFCFFDINDYGINMGFGDRSQEACKLKFTATNQTDTFRSYSLTRKESNKIGPMIAAVTKKIRESIVLGLSNVYPSFTESSESDLDMVIDELSEWTTLFPKPALGTAETYLSRFDPFTRKPFATPQVINMIATPTEIPFGEGTDGVLGDVIESGEFDWNQTAMVNGKEEKIWEYMLNNFWSGKTDDALFDGKLVRDSIHIGDGYPLSVQQTIDDLVLYREDEFNYDKSRPEILFIKTANENITTMEDVYTWQRTFTNKKNMAVIPSIGRFRFTDPTTGAQVYMSGWFSYLGKNGQLYQYLKKGVDDPFASGSWSYVNKAAQNSEELIPRSSTDLTQLTNYDISYFRMQSSGIFKLGTEVAYNPGFTSVLKNIGYIINNNRIKNITYNILFDNNIIKPTSVNLEALEDEIKTQIAPYTKVFNDKVTVKVKVSEHPQEINKNIVLADVNVYADHFSTRNRCQVTINDAAATEE